MSSPLSASELRARLGHPVVDADGHYIESAPVFKHFLHDYVKEIGGGDLAKRFDQAVEEPDVAARIVFATGDTVSEDVRSFLDTTGNHYISKPFQLDEVDRVIEAILGRDADPGGDAGETS